MFRCALPEQSFLPHAAHRTQARRKRQSRVGLDVGQSWRATRSIGEATNLGERSNAA